MTEQNMAVTIISSLRASDYKADIFFRQHSAVQIRLMAVILKRIFNMEETILLLIFLGVYILAQVYILPKMGIST